MYRKLKRVWSHNDMNYIPNFKETFPELKHVSSEMLCDRFCSMGVNFYAVNEARVGKLIRLTMPLAIVVIVLMYICLPIKFIATGTWYYSDKNTIGIRNWFRALKLE